MRHSKVASERVNALMQNAEKDRKKAKRYVELARKIAMRCTLNFPKKWKRRICKKCNSFLRPGENCRVRIRKNRVIVTCLECGNAVRIPCVSKTGLLFALPNGNKTPEILKKLG